jgi:hypothetical protein
LINNTRHSPLIKNDNVTFYNILQFDPVLERKGKITKT